MVDNDLDLGRIDPINELDLDFHKTYKLAKFQNFSLKTATCVPQKQVLTNTHTKQVAVGQDEETRREWKTSSDQTVERFDQV